MIAMRPRHTTARRTARGFTLIELLVALFIAAVMFAMGYGAINQALQSRGSIRRHQQDLLQLETAMRVMEQDFVQIAPRPVRTPDGNGYLMCLQGGSTSDISDGSSNSDSPDDSSTSDATDTSDASDTGIPLVSLTRPGCRARSSSGSHTSSTTARWCASTGTCSMRRSPACR
jgi:prepilin-type N-terminal cleavage/methylation domain-containing protein